MPTPDLAPSGSRSERARRAGSHLRDAGCPDPHRRDSGLSRNARGGFAAHPTADAQCSPPLARPLASTTIRGPTVRPKAPRRVRTSSIGCAPKAATSRSPTTAAVDTVRGTPCPFRRRWRPRRRTAPTNAPRRNGRRHLDGRFRRRRRGVEADRSVHPSTSCCRPFAVVGQAYLDAEITSSNRSETWFPQHELAGASGTLVARSVDAAFVSRR